MNVWRKPLLAAAGKVDSCGSLLVNVASGNKVVLTGWNHDNLLTDAEKARLILRSAGYACGGKKYDELLALSSGYKKGKTGKCGTLPGSCPLPHARGGVSAALIAVAPKLYSSPRPWGCFSVVPRIATPDFPSIGMNRKCSSEYNNRRSRAGNESAFCCPNDYFARKTFRSDSG